MKNIFSVKKQNNYDLSTLAMTDKYIFAKRTLGKKALFKIRLITFFYTS